MQSDIEPLKFQCEIFIKENKSSYPKKLKLIRSNY
jgi:hypothetical protein